MTISRDVFTLAAEFWDPAPEGSGGAEDRELALLCSRDLRRLIREAWPLLEPSRPFVASWHIDCVAEHLMAVTAGEIPRLIVNQPPGSSKSSVAAILWPAWEWMLRPHVRWIFASYAQTFAFRDSRKMRTLIQSRGGRPEGGLFERRGYQGVLMLLGQHWALQEDQNTKGRYDTTATGFRLATSVDGQVTGDHADRIICDDPLNPKQAHSEAERENANRWWDDTMVSRFIDSKAAAVIVQQRLHERDLTGHLLAKDEGWHHLCLPAEWSPKHPFTYPAKATLPSGRVIDGDPRTEPGELLDPIRLSDEQLKGPRARPSVFAGQFMQLPSPEGGGLFQREWYTGPAARRWQADDLPRLHHGFDRKVWSWDMAFKDTKGSDYVVGQLWGFHGADSYLLAQIRGRFDFTATLHVVKAGVKFCPEATARLVEDKANGTAVINTLRSKVGGLIAITPKESKWARAGAVAPWSEAHNVLLPAADVIPCPAGYEDEAGNWHALTPTTVDEWVHEHCTFNAGAHDDMVDAHSQALNWARPVFVEREPVMPEQGRAATVMAGVLTEKW